MQLILIPPKSLLYTVAARGWYLALPQLAYDIEYRRFHKGRHPSQWLILDNGAAEGHMPTMDELLRCAEDLEADEVVVPDVLGNMEGTLGGARVFGKYSKSEFSHGTKFMAVLQGRTLQELKTCLDEYMLMGWVDTIGIPRHTLETVECDHPSHSGKQKDAIRKNGCTYMRAHIIEYFLEQYEGLAKIHMLGASPRFEQECLYIERTFPGAVRSMDTSMPYNWAHREMRLSPVGCGVSRPSNYFDLDKSKFSNDALLHNIRTMKMWAMGRTA